MSWRRKDRQQRVSLFLVAAAAALKRRLLGGSRRGEARPALRARARDVQAGLIFVYYYFLPRVNEPVSRLELRLFLPLRLRLAGRFARLPASQNFIFFNGCLSPSASRSAGPRFATLSIGSSLAFGSCLRLLGPSSLWPTALRLLP